MSDLPPGFQQHFRKSPATEPWEPLYSRRRDDGALDLLFDVRTAHCNGRGFLHGGVLAALCDNAMGLTLANTLAHPAPQIVTISLGVDYIGSAELGARVLISPRCLRAAGGVSFCDALVTQGERVVARASASFRVRLADPTERA
jgi:uncharacterized protein (TIGR00369 family)